MEHLTSNNKLLTMGAVSLMVALALSAYFMVLDTDETGATGYEDSDSLTYDISVSGPDEYWLLISGNGPMRGFSETDNLATRYPNMVKVVISEGVTCISMFAFSGATKLVEAELPYTLEDIGIEAFANCQSLEFIDIPGGVKSIKYGTFQGCTSLVYATGAPTFIEYNAFAGCTSLEALEGGFFDSCKTIQNYAFRDCTSLRTIDLGKNLSTLDPLAFEGCLNISTVYNRSSLDVTAGSYGIPASATVLKYPVNIEVQDAVVYVGNNYRVTPVPEGYPLKVSGAPWLVVNGNTISGTPTEPGTYTVVVSSHGYSATMTIEVSQRFAPLNSPATGMIIMIY